MGIIAFILVIVALIVVHELGHFFVAKWSGMKVEEFGIGYPPRALGFTYKGTAYTLNWLPFGGFVRILGEDLTQADGRLSKESFAAKPRVLQALVLIAGIFMNLLFAWILISVVLMIGTPRALSPEEATHAADAALTVSSVIATSPAARAGLMPGDTIRSATIGTETYTGYDPASFSDFVSRDAQGVPILIAYERGGAADTVSVIPQSGVSTADPERIALGIGVFTVGTIPVTPVEAPLKGAELTWELTKETAISLVGFFKGVFTLSADLRQVSGPVGIVSAVGNAQAEGISALLLITAIISINLALINVLPVPALDGGRLLFVLIEAVIRRPIPKGVAGAVNGVGFAFLVLLMLVVTAHDIFKLFL